MFPRNDNNIKIKTKLCTYLIETIQIHDSVKKNNDVQFEKTQRGCFKVLKCFDEYVTEFTGTFL